MVRVRQRNPLPGVLASVLLVSGMALAAVLVGPAVPAGADPAPSPVVSQLQPSSGTAGGGTTVVITGSGFTGATAVSFGPNTSSAFTVDSDTTITASAPVGASAVDVTVTAGGGVSPVSVGDQFTYIGGPADIGSSGGSLTVNGVPTLFSGVNAFELGTSWGTNAGCGTMLDDTQLDSFFTSLRPGSLVRFSAFQATMVTNYFTHTLDWAPLDRVFEAAARDHQYLVPMLTGQGAPCDGGHWQGPSWYTGGYQDVFNSAANSDGRGLTPLSYWDFLQAVVNRYKASPALALWEPISEPEASTCASQYQPSDCSGHQTCPDETVAASALRSFFDVVGGEIHTLDPNHLVESGMLGGGQCGTGGSDFEYVSASPGIDVGSFHDYYGGNVLIGGDQWNGVGLRIQQMADLGKPLIDGELGIAAANGSTACVSPTDRTTEVGSKDTAQYGAGIAAILVWNWSPDTPTWCDYNVNAGDPLMTLLGQGRPGLGGSSSVAPGVSAVSSAESPVTAGTEVTVSGSGFTGSTAVAFAGEAASSYFVDADGTLSAVVPPNVTGSVDVTVTGPGGTSATISSDQLTVT